MLFKKFKRKVYMLLLPFIRIIKILNWYVYLKKSSKIKIIVGAATTKYEGWFPTDIDILDLTKEEDFERFFSQKKINNILAEHVLEHLTDKDIDLMLNNFWNYCAEDAVIRIAVPDGFHKDEIYVNSVKPGGSGEGADDHKQLFNYKSLSQKFEEYGFSAKIVEYWDESRVFHQGYVNDERGYVMRSFINDERNNSGKPVYTSLIIDFERKR